MSFLRNRLGSAATGIATVVLAAGIVSTSLQSGGSPRSPLAGAAGTLGHTRESGLPTDTGAPSLAYPALPITPLASPSPLTAPSATPATVSYVRPAEVSFPNAADGWLVGEGCGSQGDCEPVTARTTDGGAVWTLGNLPVDPRKTVFGLQILAASARDAWVWGYLSQGSGSAIFVATHNGGLTWQPIDTGSMVVASLAIDSGTVWAVTGCPSTSAACTVHLLSSSTSGGAWRDDGAVPLVTNIEPQSSVFRPSPEVVRAGGRAWVLLTTGGLGTTVTGLLVRSDDGGSAWMRLSVPCQESMAPIGLAASSAEAIMLVCGAGGGWPAPQEVWASADGGSTWQLRSRSFATVMASPLPTIGNLDSQGLPAGIVMVDAQTAWIWGDREQDMVSHDGGINWLAPSELPYGNQGGAEGLTFSDPLHGWTFGPDGLWTTVDGGRHWQRESVIGLVPGFAATG